MSPAFVSQRIFIEPRFRESIGLLQ